MAARAEAGSRAAAITLMCMECMGGTYREAKACTARDCPLYPVSPAAKAARERKQ